jgi:cellulose biosynthesis protein BcsQ
LRAALANKSFKVLMIDLAPQGNLSQISGIEPPEIQVADATHTTDFSNTVIKIRDFILALKASRELENKNCFDVRNGIHTSSLVAGVVGMKNLLTIFGVIP